MSFEYGMGWRPELLDVRDYRPEMEEVTCLLNGTCEIFPQKGSISSAIDLSEWCSPVEDQGQLGSCTAHAAIGLVEYFERRAYGRHVDASRLFIYRVTRKLMGVTGDTGAYLRDAMKSLVLIGAPPEAYWPYKVADFDKEPPSFVYSLASNWKALKYFRLDDRGGTDKTLERIRYFLNRGYPSMFGFSVYDTIRDAEQNGEIPYPSRHAALEGGHAVMAVGYDDAKSIGGKKGAIKIRNSWGSWWGEEGYGWLPYEYVLSGLADDWWSIQSQSWVDTERFG